MKKKIFLIGNQYIEQINIIEVLQECKLKGFEIIQDPSIESVRNLDIYRDGCLFIINDQNINKIKKFLLFQKRKKFFIPIILILDVDRKELEMLISLGACHIIHPKDVNKSTITQSLLSALEQKRVELELRSRDMIMQGINCAAEVFLSQLDWDSRINDVLAKFGAATLADKVCMYKSELKPNLGHVSTLFGSWTSCEEFPPDEIQSDNECGLQGYITKRWFKTLSKGRVISGAILDFPSEEQPRLAKRQIKSLAIIPIFTDDVWWGFLTFEHCQVEKNWTSNEIDTLKTAAKIFGAGISRLDVETRLTHLATHDYLTNLPNRFLLEDRFELAISRADRNDKKFGVIAVDIDKFKQVNDLHGHPFGDKVLAEIAWRLSETLRTSDTCARVGGDEFTVLAEGIRNKKDLLRVMEKLNGAITPPIIIDGKEVRVTASMGGSIYPNHGKKMEELMKAADIALYDVKDIYSGCKIFSNEQFNFFEK